MEGQRVAIRIVTDSTCDLPNDVVERYGIVVLPMFINVGEFGYRDGIDITRQDFYERLPDWDPAPTTATPSLETFQRAYAQLASEGADQVLSIHISRSLSATMDVAQVAAEQTSIVHVETFDSQQLSLGTGYLVETAAQAASQGRTLKEIKELLIDQIGRTHVFAALDTLEFLRRSGRMSGIMAGLGSVLQIKPLLKMYAGNPTSERVRTNRKAIERVLALLNEKLPLERLAILHTNAEKKARDLFAAVTATLPFEHIPAVDITPVIGAHIGPGAVGFVTVSAK
jgi:DegV family protein with EDD domain